MKRILVIAILVLSTCDFHFGQIANPIANPCSSNPPLRDISSTPSWNGWSADIANTRYQPQARAGLTAADAPRLKLQWAFGFPGAKAVSGQPSLVAGRIFVSADNSDVYSLDSVSGCVHWSFHAEAVVRSSVTVEQASGKYAAFFGDARANVYSLDAETGWFASMTTPRPESQGLPSFLKDACTCPSLQEKKAPAGALHMSAARFEEALSR
jgi:polyvinyl alcohol dehydrogenase (cytochrome)